MNPIIYVDLNWLALKFILYTTVIHPIMFVKFYKKILQFMLKIVLFLLLFHLHMIDITWAHVLCCCGSQYLDLKFLEQNLPLLAVSDKLFKCLYLWISINCLFLKQHTVPKCHTQKTHKTKWILSVGSNILNENRILQYFFYLFVCFWLTVGKAATRTDRSAMFPY